MSAIFFDKPGNSDHRHQLPNKTIIRKFLMQKIVSSYGSYSARATGSHVGGTSFFTLLDNVIWDLSNSIVYKPMNQPSNARILVVDASLCQQPLKPNIVLKSPDGIFPDNDNSWLKCVDIWTFSRHWNKNTVRFQQCGEENDHIPLIDDRSSSIIEKLQDKFISLHCLTGWFSLRITNPRANYQLWSI